MQSIPVVPVQPVQPVTPVLVQVQQVPPCPPTGPVMPYNDCAAMQMHPYQMHPGFLPPWADCGGAIVPVSGGGPIFPVGEERASHFSPQEQAEIRPVGCPPLFRAAKTRQPQQAAEAKPADEKDRVRPCGHNTWEKVGKKRGRLVLHCLQPECKAVWKTRPEAHSKCDAFFAGSCPKGGACECPHIYAGGSGTRRVKTRKWQIANKNAAEPGADADVTADAGEAGEEAGAASSELVQVGSTPAFVDVTPAAAAAARAGAAALAAAAEGSEVYEVTYDDGPYTPPLSEVSCHDPYASSCRPSGQWTGEQHVHATWGPWHSQEQTGGSQEQARSPARGAHAAEGSHDARSTDDSPSDADSTATAQEEAQEEAPDSSGLNLAVALSYQSKDKEVQPIFMIGRSLTI